MIEPYVALGAATLGQWVWRANDLYDPQYSMGGHQPAGFDQLMAMYQRFTVLRSQATVENLDTTVNNDEIFRIIPMSNVNEVATVYGTGGVPGILEMSGSRTLVQTSGGLRQTDRSISLSMDIKRRAGVQSLRGLAEFSGTVAASPTTVFYYNVVGVSATGAAINHSPPIRLTLLYWCEFSQPLPLNPS